jgi:hypothetical protein
MSTEIRIDWASAQRHDDDIVMRTTESPTPEWWDTFTKVAAQWEGETRGQTWRGLTIDPDAKIRVEGIDTETKSHDLRTYVDSLVETVNRQHDQNEARDRVEREQAELTASDNASKLDDLASQLRDET